MKFIILKLALKLISVYSDKIRQKKQERKYTKADKVCGLLGVFKDNSKGIDTMGCLSTVIGIFIVMGALAAFGAVFFCIAFDWRGYFIFPFFKIYRDSKVEESSYNCHGGGFHRVICC